MPRADTLQTNFTTGEVSHKIRGRVDINQYFNGAETIENFQVMPQGGLRNRPGTKHLSEVHDSSKRTRLVPFTFSDEQAYMLEFGDYVIRIYRNDALVEVSGMPITIATPYTEDEIFELQWTQSADVLYLVHKNHYPKKLSRTAHTMWTLTNYANTDGPYFDLNKTETTLQIHTIVDSRTLSWSTGTAAFVSGDVGDYVEWRDGDQWRLGQITSYVSANEVVVDEVDSYFTPPDDIQITFTTGPQLDAIPNTIITFGPGDVGKYARDNSGNDSWHQITSYISQTQVATTAALAAIATPPTYPTDIIIPGTRTITAKVTASDALFSSGDVGRQLRFDYDGTKVWGTITNVVDSTNVDVTLNSTPPVDPDQTNNQIYNHGYTKLWQLGAWSETTGYPRTVVFHEQRLVFAGSKAQPHTIWSSVSGDFENMSPTEADSSVEDDNAINKTYADNHISIPAFLSSGPVLLLGTDGGVYQMKAASINDPMTPANTIIAPQTNSGAQQTLPAQKVGVATLYVQKGGRKLRELTYNFEIDRHVAANITVFADHLFQADQAVDLCYQEEPYGVLWLLRNDGQLVGATYDREQKVIAYHRHIIGGTNAVIESIASLYDTATDEDALYMVVKRLINGAEVRYVEKLTKSIYPSSATDNLNLAFLDSHYKYTGTATSTITGLSHLEGETVGVVADGAYIGDKTVSSGQITLTDTATNVYVGYTYTAQVVSLPIEGGSQIGASLSKKKKASQISIRVEDTTGLTYGVLGSTESLVDFRSAGAPMDEVPPMRSTDVKKTIQGGWEPDTRWVIKQTQPYPLNIVAVLTEVTTGHG